MTIISIITASLIFGVISSLIASARTLNTRSWFLWGVIGGPLTLLALLLLPKDWLQSFNKS